MTKNPYLFQGQRLDPETGLYYFKNRYYDPVHGRFITRDPAGMADGPNLYAFVNNNPINFVDPLGLTFYYIDPTWLLRVLGVIGQAGAVAGASAASDSSPDEASTPESASPPADPHGHELSPAGFWRFFVYQVESLNRFVDKAMKPPKGGVNAPGMLPGNGLGGLAQLRDTTQALREVVVPSPEHANDPLKLRILRAADAAACGAYNDASKFFNGRDLFTGEQVDTKERLVSGVQIAIDVAMAIFCARSSLKGQAGEPLPPTMTGAEIETTLKGLPIGKNVPVVQSEAELRALYQRLSVGGKPATPPGYNGTMVELPDGTRVGLRNSSSSGGPTIDVVPVGQEPMKVHVQQ